MFPPRTQIWDPSLNPISHTHQLKRRTIVTVTHQNQVALVQVQFFPLQIQWCSAQSGWDGAYQSSAFENDRVITWSLTIGKRAYSLGAFVFICEEEVVQSLMTEGLEEPFTVIG